jgi:hypothetical protein
MTEELKQELVLFVLERTPIWFFNLATKSYSVQKLYARCKQDLFREYPNIMRGNLYYAIAMSEAFEDYQCNEVELPTLCHRLNVLKHSMSFYKKCRPYAEYIQKVEEHNVLVEKYNELLLPQNKLITVYKKVQRSKNQKAKA